MKLTIGITGHRDLVEEEVPALKEIVRDFFLQLRNDFPELDLQLITPLAEGADRLVTDVALTLGIELVVPLPMEQAEYEKDFSSKEAIEKFRETLRQARVIHLQTLTDAQGGGQNAANHERQYAQLGVFISNHSQILLALWDGKPSTAVGGTAGVVSYHLTAVMPGYSVAEESTRLLTDNENDLAYHVVCSRDRPDGEPASQFRPLETAWVTAHYGRQSDGRMPPDYEAMLLRLQDYDQDEERYRSMIEHECADLLENAPDIDYPPGVDAISRQHGVADWLAIHFQKRVFGSLMATHGIAVFIGLVFILYSEFDGLDYLVSIFLMAFMVGFAIFKIGERRHWHRKYLDYRALAEGLRVQFYWSLAGVIDIRSAEFAYDNFLQKQDVDLGWIRHVMRSVSLSRSRDQLPSPEWLDWVIDEWVGDAEGGTGQLSYYRRKEQEMARRYQRTTYLGKVALWVGILIAVLLMLTGTDISDLQRNWLLVLMGIFPLIAGVRDAYSHKKAEKELIKQYHFMHGVFANARRLLDGSDDPRFRRRVLRALGNAALEEDAEWILMHRERPLEHSSF